MDGESMNKLKTAFEWVMKHDQGGQRRRDGRPYSFHPIAVSDIVAKNAERWNLENKDIIDLKIVAILHDIVEDNQYTGVDFDMLIKEFGEKISYAVGVLTKTKGKNYCDFIQSILNSDNFLAWMVKIADLQHNMSDLEEGTQKDKYRLAEKLLCSIEDNWFSKKDVNHPPPF